MANAIAQIKQTPKGELEWVVISGDGKENLSGKMKYTASLVLDPEVKADAAFEQQIKNFWKENKPAGFKKEPKSLGIYPHQVKTDETDEDGKPIYEEDGKLVAVFSTDTTYPKGDPKVVKVYNAKAKEVQLGEKKIGNGSIGRIAGAMGIYTVMSPNGKSIIDAGVTLYLNGVMITKLEEFTGNGPEFEADEEDGWEGEEGWTGDEDSAEAEVEKPKGGPRL